MRTYVRHTVKTEKRGGWVTWCGLDTSVDSWYTGTYTGHIVQFRYQNKHYPPSELCEVCLMLHMTEE